jgi:hypothetical protein
MEKEAAVLIGANIRAVLLPALILNRVQVQRLMEVFAV